MEDVSDKAPKRRGRPAIERPERKLANLTFRVRGTMRERLQSSADARGLSISEEVERRIDLSLDMALDPFKTIALRMIVEKWKMVDALVGEGCRIDDPTIYARKAFEAVEDALRAVDDPGWARGQSGERVKDFYGRLIERGIMQEIAERNSYNLEASTGAAAHSAIDNEIWEGMADLSPVPKKTKAEWDLERQAEADRKAKPSPFLTPEEMTGPVDKPHEGSAQSTRRHKGRNMRLDDPPPRETPTISSRGPRKLVI